jgi:hypothetical protein
MTIRYFVELRRSVPTLIGKSTFCLDWQRTSERVTI